MPTNAATPLLMGCSIADLRKKLLAPHSPLQPWWQHFVRLSREDSVWFSPYTVLTALVTEDAADRARVRESFLRMVALRAEGEQSNEVQFHTHVISAPLARWAIFYDWIADEGYFTPAEDAAIRDMLLDYAHVFSLPSVTPRRLDFDNQSMANAFSAATIGYLLGVKRGDDARARRIFNTGAAFLQALLGIVPVGGYSPEGSTYHEQVVLPTTLLSSLLLEQALQIPIIDQGLPPTNRPIRQMLETSLRMIGPGGLLPAWDDYGFQHASIKSALAFLAKHTNNPAPLATIRAMGMWYRTAHPAWEIDDRLWTLIWWPSELDNGEAAVFTPWMEPQVGGALQDPTRKIRLFQYWDECGGVPSSGRSNVDPNAITLETEQSALLLDGNGRLDPPVIEYPDAAITAYIGERTIQTVKEYVESTWGGTMPREDAIRSAMGGSVGLSNSLVVDGESWYVPLAPRTGSGQALHALGALQAIRSDATSYYTDRYDVSRVTRSSMLVRGRYVLVSDRFIAATPHALTWQAFLRVDAEIKNGRVVQQTPEQVRCDFIPLQQGTLDLTPAPTYPKYPAEGRSIRLRHTVPAATDIRIDMAMAPRTVLALVADVTDGWTRDIAGNTDVVALDVAYLSDPETAQESPRSYRRTVTITPQAGKHYFLKIRNASHHLQVTVNDQPVAATTTQVQGIWKDSTTHMPWLFDITAALRTGENTIAFNAPWFHGETLRGPAELFVAEEPIPVQITRTGLDTFRVQWGTETDELVIEREGPAVWLGGDTDARYACLNTDGEVIAFDVTRLSLPGKVTLRAAAPCDINWTPERTAFARLTGAVQLEWATGSLALEAGGCIEVTYQGTSAYEITLDAPSVRQLVVNGTPNGFVGGPASPKVTVTLAPAGAPPATEITSASDVYALAEHCGVQAGARFIAALGSADWRVQMAAAEEIGRLGITDAVPALLALFAEGESEIPYPPLTHWWSWSKMLRGDDRLIGLDPTVPLPMGVKRWRVKCAVVTALGKLGDQRAAAPIAAALLRCDDFFPVGSQLAVALGRLGDKQYIPVLERHYNHAEISIRVHSRLSLALLKGEIDRRTFEAKTGIG